MALTRLGATGISVLMVLATLVTGPMTLAMGPVVASASAAPAPITAYVANLGSDTVTASPSAPPQH